MPKIPRVKKLVILDDGVVKTRAVRRRPGPAKYAPDLQGVLMDEGEDALRQVGMKWYQGFVRKGGK